MTKRFITSALATAALHSVAFANAPAAASNKPAGNAPVTAPAATSNASKPRTAPELTSVRTDIAMPTIRTNRGSKSSYDFDKLTAVGASFGVKNKTAKQLASIVSNQNKKFIEARKDTNGNVIFKMKEITDASGNKTNVPTNEPETEVTKHFFAVDVDAKTDPDGASVRVFRDK